MDAVKSFKLVVVGDGCAGKTCMLGAFIDGKIDPNAYVPTVIDNHSKALTLTNTNESVVLNLWDTAGQEAYDTLRKVTYDKTDLFLLCSPVDNRTALANVKTCWAGEIRNQVGDVPIFFVSTKTDLRADEKTVSEMRRDNKSPVTFEEARAVAKDIGAVGFAECSALTGDGIENVFQEAAQFANKRLQQKIKKSKSKEICSFI